MRILACMITAVVLLAGCASFEEAYYVDREFGLAQQATWEGQIAYPDYRYAAKTPITIEGVTAEEIMGVYNNTFAKEPEGVDVFQLGVVQ